MSISISSSNSSVSSATAWLSKELQASGVSSSGAATAAGDLLNAAETSLSANPDESDGDFRAALDKQIDQDVTSGKISQDDADKVKKALDQMTASSGDNSEDAGSTASADASGGASAAQTTGGAESAGGAGGGAGGGSAQKTETSEAVTISGNIKTTVITYSDGSTATETATATKADHRKYDPKSAAPGATKASQDDAVADQTSPAKVSSSNDAQAAQDYLAQTPPGTLFTKAA